ncbi:MAG: hypothetical protein OEZ59_00310 [Deltaproteobacteria bacterium]|nr:hypothetical protein [Deltaproteobacteria bacterium]
MQKQSHEGGTPAPPPAEKKDPAALKTALQVQHGFTKSGLEAASKDVEMLLREFIRDPKETPTVKRQAIKALALYPNKTNLGFIKAELKTAPVGQQRLLLDTVKEYKGVSQPDMKEIFAEYIKHQDTTVRHSASWLASNLAPTDENIQLLDERLMVEKEPQINMILDLVQQRLIKENSAAKGKGAAAAGPASGKK